MIAIFVIVSWIIGFWATLLTAESAVTAALGPNHLDLTFYTLIPFLLIGLGEWRKLQELWPVWPAVLARSAYVLIAGVVSCAQIGWIDEFNFNSNFYPMTVAWALGSSLLATGILAVLRRGKYLEAKPDIIDLFLFVSVIAAYLPLVTPHSRWPVVGAGIFMAYWALIGWTGLRMGYRGMLNGAIVIIALRLIVVYIEVFGSLLSTGIGLILSGGLLMALVWGLRKLIHKLGQSL